MWLHLQARKRLNVDIVNKPIILSLFYCSRKIITVMQLFSINKAINRNKFQQNVFSQDLLTIPIELYSFFFSNFKQKF